MAESLKFQIGDVVEWWSDPDRPYGTYRIVEIGIDGDEYRLLTIKCIATGTIGKSFTESTERINKFCRLVKNGVSLMIECL